MAGRYNREPQADIPPEPKLDYSEMLDALLSMEGSVGNTYRRMTSYSLGNCALFMAQGIAPQPVATFKGWEAVDRHVVKGAKARWVLRPINVKSKYETNDDGSPKVITRFKLVRAIFPLEDTAGEPLPKLETREWSQDQAMQTLNIRQVPFDDFNANVQGWSINRELAINPIAKYPKKTLLHEMGHIVLGHTIIEDDNFDANPHRGIREFQAESVAHLGMMSLGLFTDFDRGESAGYISGWLKGETPPQDRIKDAIQATDKIVNSGRLAEPVAQEVA